jgi:hypothetical protein
MKRLLQDADFPKEMYEPLWEDVYKEMKALGRQIRGIWIADVAHLGASSVLNEGILGNDCKFWRPRLELVLLTLCSKLGGSFQRPPLHDQSVSRADAASHHWHRT